MKRYNVSVPKSYEKNGEEKTMWSNVGTLVHFEATPAKKESFILELNMFPSVKFGVFEQTPKIPQTVQEIKKDINNILESRTSEDELDPEEIVF